MSDPLDIPKATCLDCDAPYGTDGWCDIVIPNEIWNALIPGVTDGGGGTLCFRCMTKRLEMAGLKDIPVIVASGPYRDANEKWRLIGVKHGEAAALAQIEVLQKERDGLLLRIDQLNEADRKSHQLCCELAVRIGKERDQTIELRAQVADLRKALDTKRLDWLELNRMRICCFTFDAPAIFTPDANDGSPSLLAQDGTIREAIDRAMTLDPQTTGKSATSSLEQS